jgi:hypothetical protein
VEGLTAAATWSASWLTASFHDGGNDAGAWL